MNLYLEPGLASHRHGRFFISQVDAEPVDDMPNNGILLMHGKTFQGLDTSQQEAWWQWTSKPGRLLLLLPPYDVGDVFSQLDWQIVVREDVADSSDGILPCVLSPEVNVSLSGNDGEFGRLPGHQWTDYSVNTRYVKQHQGCGVFAATCLPLWSISLLDHAQDTLDWLEGLMALAGKANAEEPAVALAPEVHLEPTDYTLMVCMQAWGIFTAKAITSSLAHGTNSFISLSESDVVEGVARLQELGLVDDAGLTSAGAESLSESPYWGYVERLKEEASL